MAIVVIVLGLAVIGLIAWIAARIARKRREALLAFGAKNDLTFSRVDVDQLVTLPFRLFSMGDGRGCENTLSGSWKGMPVREADYWYYNETTDSNGHRTKSYKRFSLVICDIPADLPHVTVAKEGFLSRFADHLGFRDIDFESEDFNRAFQITADDREFAFKIVDARMIRWLLSTESAFGFEVLGPKLLVYSERRRPEELISLFGAAAAFRDHVPKLVWTQYGTGDRPLPGTATGETGRSST